MKYLLRIKFEAEGFVEETDIIGAIFGQTEGLFGPELDLNELQKTWKLGRIEIELTHNNNMTQGEVKVPLSVDIEVASLIAAAIESIERVGPSPARFAFIDLEDIRAKKLKKIRERAKEIAKGWAIKVKSESDKILKEIEEATGKLRIILYGKEKLPAGPEVETADTVIVVEGRGDVVALLRAGINNVIGIEGVGIPSSLIELAKNKKLTVFLDGDRGGDLILKEMKKVLRIDRVVRAPEGREVEELFPAEILELLKRVEEVERQELVNKLREKGEDIASLKGTLEALIFDKDFDAVERIQVSELIKRLREGFERPPFCIIFDGIVTERLIVHAEKAGVKAVVGERVGELPPSLETKLLVDTIDNILKSVSYKA